MANLVKDMGILYLIFSLLIVGITSICIIGYVVKTRKYHFLWIIVVLIVLLYSANELYNYYRTCQIPRIIPLSFRQVNADEIHSIIPYNKNYPVYVLEFNSDKKLEDFSRAPKIAFLSPFIERKGYQSILEIGKDSVLESIYIYPSKKTNRYDYIALFQNDNESIERLQHYNILYFRLFFLAYLAPIYGTLSVPVPMFDKHSRDSDQLFFNKYIIP